MKISVILAHPNLQKESFNHAIAQIAVEILGKNNHTVNYHDLYAEKFDPIITAAEIAENVSLDQNIARHCDEIAAADGIVIVHPNWWGQPPAILKGWVDRVLRVGVAYRFLEGDNGEGIPEGLLKAKTAVVFNTCNTPHEWEMKRFGDPLEKTWKNCIFNFCGIKNVYRKMFGIVIISTPEQRKEWLAEIQETMENLFPPIK